VKTCLFCAYRKTDTVPKVKTPGELVKQCHCFFAEGPEDPGFDVSVFAKAGKTAFFWNLSQFACFQIKDCLECKHQSSPASVPTFLTGETVSFGRKFCLISILRFETLKFLERRMLSWQKEL